MQEKENLFIERVEPLSWWTGMRTPLQLMIYGKDLSGSQVVIPEPGVSVTKVHTADSPHYIFVDVNIEHTAVPGTYTLEIRKDGKTISYPYRIDKRRKGSASRKSFSPADLVYLLMPDRFANGDPENDSTPDTLEKADRKDPVGRHGGDLQGIMDHMDYLVDLGVTALWITPPQLCNEPKASYHGYASADYYHIDPRFGNNDLYKKLVKKAHQLKLKVIMDAVPNHCGKEHWWTKDPPFKDWIHQEEYPVRSNYRLATVSDPNSSILNEMHTVKGWFDANMPDLCLENPYLLQYLLQAYIWWIEWADLDGLRVDTFPYNDKYAIAEWTRKILEEYPNLNIVAECWHYSAATVSYWLGTAQNTDRYVSYLPSVMDFPLQKALDDGLFKNTTATDGGMNLVYEAIAQDFLYCDPRNLMIFLDNHDVERFADIVKGNIHKIKIGITLLATLRGIPQLYYGTEFGFRSTDMSKGENAARKDFSGGWKSDRKNLFTEKGRNRKETEIYEHTRKLFNWRKGAKVIHEGKTTHFLPVENTYSFFRHTEKEAVFVFVNPSGKDVKIDWKRYMECTQGYTSGINILNGKKVTPGHSFTVKAGSSAVIELFP